MEKVKIERKHYLNLDKVLSDYENCIICHRHVDIKKTTPINMREHYIEGAGQLCPICYERLYSSKNIVLDDKFFLNEINKYKNTIKFEKKSGYEFFKRSIDFIFALVTIIPVSLLIGLFCIIIRIDSKGNPIFSQVRVGKDGKLIKIHKLRSMKIDAEANGQKWASNNDSRITKVGRFIRKYRIDELPQLFDVLIGDMSLIGPRPEVPKLTKQFNDESPGFVTRLVVTPGLSGWAQINGGYELSPKEKWLKDIEYIENRNIKMYIKIFYLTIKIVLTGEGAR